MGPTATTLALMAEAPAGEVVIRVRGEFEREVPAERGTANLVVLAQGAEPGPVRARVEADATAALADVRGWHDPDAGPVRRYVVGQVRTSVQQPSHKGRPRPAVYHASVSISVEFDDVTRLGGWLSSLGAIEGVTVQGIGWDLAAEHRRELERAVRQEALRQARERAQDYADALDLGPVRPRQVADVGLLGSHPAPSARAVGLSFAAAPESSGDGLGELLRPDDVTVQATVEAEFTV
ncbi:SIMPL domain-containing protein [Pseudonocardia saturnea]|nr:SIMPL domain-containing protein [Pseudonocardia autotrophica]GEC25768.1 SIMPL domain-containing protein [Pseudonocardia saturnea]